VIIEYDVIHDEFYRVHPCGKKELITIELWLKYMPEIIEEEREKNGVSKYETGGLSNEIAISLMRISDHLCAKSITN